MSGKLIKNHQGITLVELMVSIAIFSVAMVSMFALLSVATRQYTYSNNEIAVQNEAQTLLNHLENIFVDANQNVVVNGKDVYVMNDTSYCVLQWDDANENIYYFTFSPEADSDYMKATTKEAKYTAASLAGLPDVTETNINKYLLAEYVTEFSVVPNLTYGYVSVALTVTREKAHYSASKNIDFRNELETKVASNVPESTSDPEGPSGVTKVSDTGTSIITQKPDGTLDTTIKTFANNIGAVDAFAPSDVIDVVIASVNPGVDTSAWMVACNGYDINSAGLNAVYSSSGTLTLTTTVQDIMDANGITDVSEFGGFLLQVWNTAFGDEVSYTISVTSS